MQLISYSVIQLFRYSIIPLFRYSIVLLFSCSALYAQDPVRICGEYTYHSPDNVPAGTARRIALERARSEALSNKFGIEISVSEVLTAIGENADVSQFFSVTSTSHVKGEWLEDIGEPQFTISYERDRLIVKVSVCGYAREATASGVALQARLLRNGFDSRFESLEFRDGDEMYLLFQSPVDGFLAVYWIDETRTAYCLLPYSRARTGRVEIEAGTEYIFFSARHAGRTDAAIVDEYVLTGEKDIEHDTMYIIFSPNEFTKASDAPADEEALPRQLPFDEFQRWLTANRTRDRDMQVDFRTITIRK